jgi:S-adenosylmethionine hydrolase
MITLLTDFGAADYFVAAVKGAILTTDPSAQIIDITHEIPPQDIASAAFTLGACFRDFPKNTVHLAVVDPGVGSMRRPIVVEAAGQFFVGPDNGIFSYIYAHASDARVFHATRSDIFRQQVGATFHARDVFAPLAAQLARRLDAAIAGEQIFDYLQFDIPQPSVDAVSGEITGEIIHVDRFGNCITNLTVCELDLRKVGPTTRLQVGEETVTRFGTHFADFEQDRELFAYFGSAAYWEIGLWCASAAARLGAQRGMKVTLLGGTG